MKTTVLHSCFWAFVLLAFISIGSADNQSKSDSNKQKHIAIAVGNSIVIYNHERNGSIVSHHEIPHIIHCMTYDPLNDTLIGVTNYEAANRSYGSLIFRYDLKTNQVNDITELPKLNVGSIKSIKFDYLGNNLYISIDHNIVVYSLDTGEKTEISYSNEIPYDIILVPEKGIMFVVLTSNGHYDAYIASAQMNNYRRREMIFWGRLPDGASISLAYDKDDGKFFWIDRTDKTIYYDRGGMKKIFRDDVDEPEDIIVIDDKIFWTSYNFPYLRWTDRKNFSIDAKEHGIDIKLLTSTPVIQSIDSLATREIINNNRQLHPCSRNNGDCSHVCLVTNATDKLCACPPELYLDFDDKKTCTLTRVKANSRNNSCSNRRVWIGLIFGLIAIVVYSQ